MGSPRGDPSRRGGVRRGLWICLAGILALPAPSRGQGIANPVPDLPRLETALGRYRALAERGGWPAVAEGPVVRPGDADGRVAVLRERLRLEDYRVEARPAEAARYDSALVGAVRRFQALHGLVDDGIVGPATLAALNVPAARREAEIEGGIRLVRGTADSLGDRFVVVNIPGFVVDLVEGGRSVLRLRAIVGRTDWPTPVASSRITEVVFRPVWRVPRSIALREVVPLARRDPAYLRRVGMRVYRDSVGGIEVDPGAIDWSAGSALQFGQEPGPANPLGGVRLVFHTPYDVYLHGTPNPASFERPQRALSHGCVRVERVERLVARLLPEWPEDSIAAAMRQGRDRRVRLSVPMPVHLRYWTVWVEDDGLVAFRKDLYRKAPRP